MAIAPGTNVKLSQGLQSSTGNRSGVWGEIPAKLLNWIVLPGSRIFRQKTRHSIAIQNFTNARSSESFRAQKGKNKILCDRVYLIGSLADRQPIPQTSYGELPNIHRSAIECGLPTSTGATGRVHGFFTSRTLWIYTPSIGSSADSQRQ